MGKIVKFLEENSKLIVKILVLLGLLLIIILWSVGLFISQSCGGQWINLCFGWDVEYYWINSGYIATIFFIVSIYLIIKIKKIDNKIKKIQIACLILLLGIIGRPLFFLVSPDFKFYLTPVTSQYKDKKGKITDLDKYLELTTKYCDNFKEDNNFHFKYSRETMCSGKFETNFNTVEEYIKILEYANKYNFKYLYGITFRWVDDNVGLENLIEKYNEDTFYGYVIDKTSDLKLLNIIDKKIINNEIKLLLNKYINDINYFSNNKDTFTQDEGYKYWDNLSKKIEKELKQIPEINQNIF